MALSSLIILANFLSTFFSSNFLYLSYNGASFLVSYLINLTGLIWLNANCFSLRLSLFAISMASSSIESSSESVWPSSLICLANFLSICFSSNFLYCFYSGASSFVNYFANLTGWILFNARVFSFISSFRAKSIVF